MEHNKNNVVDEFRQIGDNEIYSKISKRDEYASNLYKKSVLRKFLSTDF